MIKEIFIIFLIIYIFSNFNDVGAQLTKANRYLVKMTEKLKITGTSDSETYEAYFHIPG